ncbi:uncharacterized protein LOC124154725 isoform X2 [Ischnura elegans]|uniref:uncharacterized protein LOC124154725 isoform X2 n=1 Tax=Ischnura elegans TaxID=197161 RepID=UPI001ED86CC2|nr:uncharacterized protein LOC124154725 isoform X2 [Ischnura elegans]
MNNRAPQPLGRGQALQMVMAQSRNSLNVTEMRMANYTNEKIMEVLEAISQRTNVDPLGQNLESRNEEHLVYEDAEDAVASMPQYEQSRGAAQSTSKADRNRRKDSSSLNTAPDYINEHG